MGLFGLILQPYAYRRGPTAVLLPLSQEAGAGAGAAR